MSLKRAILGLLVLMLLFTTGCQTKHFSVNEIITFGTYEQNDDYSNGTEPLEWRILDIQNGQALLITDKIIGSHRYNDYNEEVDWSTCTLRTWLNSEFINTVFSEDEKNALIPTIIETYVNYQFNTVSANNTKDNVFLLSIRQIERYFPDQSAKAQPTVYGKSQIINNCINDNSEMGFDEERTRKEMEEFFDECEGYYSYFLRDVTPFDIHYQQVIAVGPDGIITDEYDTMTVYSSIGLRPAIWVDLSKLKLR